MTTDNNILYGGPDIPLVHDDAQSLGEMILRQFNENSMNICFVGTKLEQFIDKFILLLLHGHPLTQVNSASGQTMTVGELHLRSIRLAKSLRFDGVVAGDVIGLCSENRAEFPVVLFAAFLVGATVAPLNTSYIEGIKLLSFNHSVIANNEYFQMSSSTP